MGAELDDVGAGGIPVGYAAVPGGLINVHTGDPDIIEVYFPNNDPVRCGDPVPIGTLLTTRGFDGTVESALARPDGSVFEAQRTAVAGQAVVTTTWLARKPGDHWNEQPDAKVIAVLRDNQDTEVSRAETVSPIRITRPENGVRHRCIPAGRRTAQRFARNTAAHAWERHLPDYAWPCNFDVSFRDGVATIISRIKLCALDGLQITHAMKRDWKAEIESFWNNVFIAHRRRCGRELRATVRLLLQVRNRIECNFVEHDEYRHRRRASGRLRGTPNEPLMVVFEYMVGTKVRPSARLRSRARVWSRHRFVRRI